MDAVFALQVARACEMSAVFRVRKSLLGRCILQKFDEKNGKVGFHDVPFRDLGDFSLVPRAEWSVTQERIARADKRAMQRRANKEAKDFEASRLSE
jgi:hypothetical protein